MYATNFFESAILSLLTGSPINAPVKMYLALFNSNPTDTGTAGTEASYSGYARQEITFSAPYVQSTGSTVVILENASEISFPEASASSNAITHVAIMDAVTGGNMWLYGPLDSSLVIQAGVTPVFRQAALQFSWSGNVSVDYKKNVLNTLRGSTCSNFTPYLALCDASGNEFNGTNYARFAVSMTTPAQNTQTGVCYSQNSAEVTSNIAGSDWGSVRIVKIYNAATNGTEFNSVDLGSSYNISTGSLFGFHAGDYQLNIN